MTVSDVEASSLAEQAEGLAALCTEAPNDTVRNCIRKYDPKKPSWQIEKALKADKKAVLVETLGFLGVPNMEKYRADTLPHELVCHLQNLFPDQCEICKQKFCVALHDKPILSYARCGQGCQNQCILQLLGKTEEDLSEENLNGQALINPNASVGLVYLCRPCQVDVIPVREEITRNQRSVQPNADASSDSRTQPSAQPVDSSQIEEGSREVESRLNGSIRPENVNNEQFNTGNRSNNIQIQNEEPQICRFYNDNRCKYGISGKKGGVCNYQHPKPCRKLLNNGTKGPRGCNKGTRCDYFHPKMCYRSLKEQICTKDDCKFIHIKFTKRSETTDRLQARDESQINPNEIPVPPSNSRPVKLMSVKTNPTMSENRQSSFHSDTEFKMLLVQMKQMQEQMNSFSNTLQKLGSGAAPRSSLTLNQTSSQPRPFLSFPQQPQFQDQYQMYYTPPQPQNYPSNLAPPGRLLSQPLPLH